MLTTLRGYLGQWPNSNWKWACEQDWMKKRRKHTKLEGMHAAGKRRQRDRRKELGWIVEDFKINGKTDLIYAYEQRAPIPPPFLFSIMKGSLPSVLTSFYLSRSIKNRRRQWVTKKIVTHESCELSGVMKSGTYWGKWWEMGRGGKQETVPQHHVCASE